MQRPRAVLALLVLVAVAIVNTGGARSDLLVCAGKESPDFNGDGHPDLAIGQPASTVKDAEGAGWVKVIYGRPPEAEQARVQLLHQGYPGIAGDPEPGSRFGYAVAFGDFDGDGFDDLAVGVPGQTVGDVLSAGSVHVVPGGPDGLDPSRSRLWHLDSPEIAGDPAAEDRFGYALASCDFDRDGFDDLAVGIPFRDTGGVENAGSVSVLYGSDEGLVAERNQLWHLGSLGVEAAEGDLFGKSLAAGDLNEDGIADLAVGSPWRDDGVGEVYVLPGSRDDGLTSSGHQRWTGVGSALLILNAIRGILEAPEDPDGTGAEDRPEPPATSSASEGTDESGVAPLPSVPDQGDGEEDYRYSGEWSQASSSQLFVGEALAAPNAVGDPPFEAALGTASAPESDPGTQTLGQVNLAQATPDPDAPGPPGGGGPTATTTPDPGPGAGATPTAPSAASPTPQAPRAATPTPAGRALGRTGASIQMYTLAAVAMLVVGLALQTYARRRRVAAATAVPLLLPPAADAEADQGEREYELIGW